MAQQTACRCLTCCTLHQHADQMFETLKDALDVLYRVPDGPYSTLKDREAYEDTMRRMEALLKTLEGQTQR